MPHLHESSRLILRPMSKSDFSFMRELHSSAEVMNYIGSGLVRSEEQTSAGMERALQIEIEDSRLGSWIVIEKESTKAIGNLIIRHPSTNEPQAGLEIGYSFLPEHWGKGFATEAAAAMVSYAKQYFGNVRMVALIEPSNSASRKILEKIGFKPAGMSEYVDPTTGDIKPTEILEIDDEL